MEFLKVLNLKKNFGKKEVLKGVDLTLNSGEIVGLIGKSGCGKSVLLNILVGILNSDSGELFFEGKRVSPSQTYFKKNIGFVFQNNTLFEELTLKENAIYFGKLYGLKRREIQESLDNLSKLLNIYYLMNTKLKYFSGGSTRRANILVSMIHSPSLLILDEPTVGLDFITRRTLLDYIKKVNLDKKVSIIFISHILEEVEYLCNRICVLNNGKISKDSNLEEIKEKHSDLNTFFEEVVKDEGI